MSVNSYSSDDSLHRQRYGPNRRSRALVSSWTSVFIHRRSPVVSAFFALSYPGFGNLLQQRYFKAFSLIIWELFINQKAKLNLGILYSMHGEFELAKEVIDERWFMMYIGIYMYSIWNSYRVTVDMNKLVLLAEREAAPIPVMRIGLFNINYLDKINPAIATFWSAIMPGLGQLYAQKIISGLFIFLYSITLIYFANVPLAIHYTLTGDFAAATNALDMQWFLYLPSIYCFVLYDAYVSAVELNKLFDKEQSAWLRVNHQPATFPMPI